MSQHIKKLRDAVQNRHRCAASHVQSVPVRETFGHGEAWEGVVEVFNIMGHPEAKRCYAWSYQGDKEEKFVTILGIPPVNSPIAAVRASIESGAE